MNSGEITVQTGQSGKQSLLRILLPVIACISLVALSAMYFKSNRPPVNDTGGLTPDTTVLSPNAAKSSIDKSDSMPSDTIEPMASQNRQEINIELGVVQASKLQECVAYIDNPTNEAWTIAKIWKSCGCTTAVSDASVIPANSKMPIRISYTPPDETLDDAKFVRVTLREPNAPMFHIRITASVRQPIAMLPQQVHFNLRQDEAKSTKSVQIENFSDRDWDGLTVLDCPPWLVAEVRQLGGAQSPMRPKADWRLSLTCDPKQLVAEGADVSKNLTIVATSKAGDLKAVVGVSAHIVRSIDAVPPSIFFGTVAVGGSTTSSCIIKVATDSTINKDLAATIVESNSNGKLELRLERLSPNLWKLHGRLEQPSRSGFAKGTLRVSGGGASSPTLEIPFSALVK